MKYIITGEILLSTVPVPGTVLRKCIFGRNFGILTPFNNLLTRNFVIFGEILFRFDGLNFIIFGKRS